ncbi:unnamed protein product [Schistosoma margrebowiei]|uniref:Major vault protein n=1 Tax=Schistosoma margrebowiei TaxID=48269 RepID=A0AA84ZHQ4_9TREM|nr:unnamed protein product [Schistosoma margrebowiei]
MKSSPDSPIISISPRHYIHVLNLNTHVTSLVVGPKTYVCQQDEKIVLGPEELTVVPTMMYCVIRNPVITDKDGVPVVDKYGQVKVRMGDEEYRFAQDPFPLYPGEAIKDIVRPLPVVLPNSALRLRAVSDFEDGNVKRIAGEEWLFEGPGTYYPRKEVEIIKCEQAKVILVNSALVMEATKDCVDRGGVSRVYGERWLVTTPGAYLPGVYEQIVDERKAITLTDRRAICVKAVKSHCDKFGKYRKAGEEWLITHEDAEYHICSALEEFVKEVDVTILRVHQFCVVVNPWDENGVPQLGRKLLVRGEKSFFLRPGEYLETGVQDAYILQNNEGLILRAKEQFVDDICGDAVSEGDSVKQKCHSARIIRASVFGLDESGKVRDRIVFPQNNLHITSVDVQSVEPVDQRTRDSLQKSVQLAIEITTNSQEAAARHEAERLEQEARGRLERQRIEDEAAAEQARRNLLEIRVQLAALESSSQAKAEAESRAEANRISSQAAVEEAKLRAEALSIETNAELERLKLARAAEIAYIKEKNELALKYKENETEIEKSRFISMVNALGADTLRAMATAESDHNLRMLNALGLQSTLITDGTTPVNLLTTAHGLIGSVFEGSSRKRTSEISGNVDEK